MFLLDTDTIIYSLKNNQTVINNFKFFSDSPKAISVITYGELIYGANHSQRKIENLAKIHYIKEIFPVIDITCAIMETFGSLKSDMRKSGKTVDDFDLLIGATAITHGYCVVTNNEKHFSQIPEVKYTNWTKQE